MLRRAAEMVAVPAVRPDRAAFAASALTRSEATTSLQRRMAIGTDRQRGLIAEGRAMQARIERRTLLSVMPGDLDRALKPGRQGERGTGISTRTARPVRG